LLSRRVGALAGFVLALIILGCMSLSFGGLSIGGRTEADGTLCQEGDVKLRVGQEQDVFYPIPYASPPNVELSGDMDHCEIVDQKADHFRIRNPSGGQACPHWHARGVKACAPTTVIVASPPARPAGTPPAPPPPVLPAPTPVGQP
jgi:hypothetical protein